MSIAQEISRIKAAKAALQSAINDKGGTLSDTQLLDDYAAAVTALPTGETVELDFVTATASDILAGKVGTDADGNPVNGTIETVTASLTDNAVTIPAGFVAEKQTLTVAAAQEPSVSENTVTVYKGYQAEQTTVEISKATATLDKNTVTIPAGYHDENTLAVPEAPSPTVVGNTVTIYPGYIAESKSIQTAGTGGGSNSMDFYRCAAVYGPRDVDVFVVSGCPTAAANGTYMPTEYTTEDWEGTKYPVYSNGTYYYCYDANNWMNWGICTDYTTMSFIYSGSGTSWSDTDWNPVEGMSSVESKVTVDTDVPKTWDGYKAVAGSDGYTLETVLTTGLTYGNGYKPIIGKIYSADASAAPALKFAIPDGAKVYASFAKNSATAETGQSITYGAIAKCTFDTVEGIPCMMVSGTYVAVNENCNLANYSMSVWHQRSSSSSHLLDVGTIENNNNMTVTLQDGSVIICAAGSGAGKVQGSIQNARTPTWVHIVITRSGTSVRYYVDGNLKLSGELNNTLIDDGLIVVCGFKHSSKIYDNSGSFAGFRFYERVLTDDEIFALANEFAPTA